MFLALPGKWFVVDHSMARAVLRHPDLDVPQSPNENMNMKTPPPGSGVLMANGEEHARMRGVLGPLLSSLRVAEILDDGYQSYSDALIASQLGEDYVDIERAISGPLVLTGVCSALGVPEQERGNLLELSIAINVGVDRTTNTSAIDKVASAALELGRLSDRLLGSSAPLNAIAGIVTALDNGLLTRDQALANCSLLLVASIATSLALLNGVIYCYALLDTRLSGSLAKLERADSFVEEVLRFVTPVTTSTVRIASADVTLGKFEISKGDEVVVLIDMANRDAQVFPRPDAFNLTRTPLRSHLAFGAGTHYCVGAPLARIIGRVLTESLANQVQRLEILTPVWVERSTAGQRIINLYGRLQS